MNLSQLKQLIQHGEAQQLEFKTSTSLLKSACTTICAFLNTKGGMLVFGVKDNGALIGQQVTDHTKQEIANEIRKIEPHAPIEIHYILLENERQVIVLEIPAGKHAPYVYDGRPFERLISSTSKMTQHQYEQLIIQRGQQNHAWDRHDASDYSIEDLDQDEIRNMVQDGVDQNRISAEALHYSIERILNKLELMHKGRITNAAVVLFAKDISEKFSQCTIKLARFRGKDKSNDFIDNQRISGNAFQLIKAADAFAARHLPIASHFVVGQIKRVDQPAVPALALREALINAISHRLYTIHGSTISLAIYDDRLELWNAGKLSPHLKLEDLRTSHDSFPRNEKIAMTFYQRGWIEMWGTGTTRMIDFCIKNQSPEPKFYEYSSGFSVVFPFKEPMHTDISMHSPDGLQELSSRQKEILRLLEQSNEMTMQEIHNCLSNPPATSTLGKDLTLLKSYGLIASQGGSKTTVWKIVQKK